MRRHLFDMLSRGVLELFPSTNTARRAGRPPANLFLNILAKKEKCKIKDAEKKKKTKGLKRHSLKKLKVKTSSEQESNVDEIPDENPGGTEILLDENQDLTIVMAPGEDPFACAVYIVDYINKADRRMSRLLREAFDEAKKGNKSVKDSLRIVSNRSEEEELLNPNINIKDIFDEYKERIKAESKQFNKLGDAVMFETLLTEIRNLELINEEEDLQGRGVNVDVFEGFEFETKTVDIAEDLIPGGNPGPQLCGDPSTFIAQPPLLSHDDFLILTRKLNDAQRDTLFHICQHFSITSPHPLYLFISGGAGVGKSVLIKAIYQCLTLLFNREAGSNPNELKILLTAFTGKAAFGIGG
ncbi:unnamed protein product [Parnassius apollo]|uniref:(apollo) hypothetical protein n=1 Tax=Parnassius apollo TaxID=110799 RepID=A0A8S3WP98_PARAO|nr:unnamed protein product [Parnassius apollo]